MDMVVHYVSKSEIQLLNYLNIPNTKENRQVRILQNKVDGYNPITNTIYEFLGDYWHGNPLKYKSNDIHPESKITFGELYNKTMKKFQILKENGYSVKYIWEIDWKNWLKNKIGEIPLKEY